MVLHPLHSSLLACGPSSCAVCRKLQNLIHCIQHMTEFAGQVSTCPVDETLWHCYFCHLNHGDVQKLLKRNLVNGIEVKSMNAVDPICEPWQASSINVKP